MLQVIFWVMVVTIAGCGIISHLAHIHIHSMTKVLILGFGHRVMDDYLMFIVFPNDHTYVNQLHAVQLFGLLKVFKIWDAGDRFYELMCFRNIMMMMDYWIFRHNGQ